MALAAPLLLGGCALAALGGIAGAAAVAPEDDEERASPWKAVDASTGQVIDLAGLQGLAADFPDSSSVRLRLLTAQIREADKSAAARSVAWLIDRGYGFSEAGKATLIAFFEGEEPEVIGRLSEAPPQRSESEVAFTVPAGARLIEGVARLRGQWFVTSIVDRTIYASDGMRWTRHALDAGSISAAVPDRGGRYLWLSSGVVPQTPAPDSAFRGLIAYDPASGKVLERIAGPEGSHPSDLVQAADGALFASDPMSGAIYTARAGDAALRILIPSGVFRSPQGIVPLERGRKLLVSDYRYGLAVIDLADKSIIRVSTDGRTMLDGFDALVSHGDWIVGIQNGVTPQRIVRFRLDNNASRVLDLAILEADHPDWIEPTGAAIHDGALYYVATGQWERFGEGGAATIDAPPLPTVIRRIALPL